MERYTTALQRDGGCLHEYTDPGVPRLFVLVAIHGRWRRLNNTVPATPNKYEQPSPSVTTASSINHFAEFLKISDRFKDIPAKRPAIYHDYDPTFMKRFHLQLQRNEPL